MPDELPVHINREELHALEVPPSYEAHGPFDVTLFNHGESLHVHVHLDDALSRVADIPASNHYVERETARSISVTVDEAALARYGPVHGKIKVASAYGAQTRWIDVELSEDDEEDEKSVEVDESLAEPPAREESTDSSLLGRPELPVLALGGIALLIALLAALLVQNTLVLLGSLVVLGGVLVALYLLLVD